MTKDRRLLVLIALAAVIGIVLAIAWFGGAGVGDRVTSAARADDDVRRATTAVDNPATPGDTVGRLEREAKADGQVAGSRAIGRDTRVRILDEHDQPIAGALVRFTATRPLIGCWWSTPVEPETALADQEPLRSDTAGNVQLPTDAEVVFVCARAGERYGHRTFALMPGRDRDLIVSPDIALRIAAIGPGGERWAGVPIEFSWQEMADHESNPTTSEELGKTGADGSFTFPHAQTIVFWHRDRMDLTLRPIVAGVETGATTIRLDASRHDEVALPCPPHGWLRVRALGNEGRPVQHELRIDLVPQRDGAEQIDLSALVSQRDGEARIGPVVLGERWVLTVDDAYMAKFVGPQFADEVVAVDTRRPDAQSWAQMTLVLPDGRFAADCEIESQRWRAWTDDLGRLSIPLGPEGGNVEMRIPSRHAYGTVAVPAAPEQPKRLELGEVRLLGETMLVTGRAVDAVSGQPLMMVRVAAEAEPDGEFASVRTDLAGAFELWGTSHDSFDVAAIAGGHEALRMPQRLGARDVVLRLVPQPMLGVTLRGEPDLPLSSLLFRVRHCTGEGNTVSTAVTSLERPGNLCATIVVPNADDLELLVQAGIAMPPIARVPQEEWVATVGGYTVDLDLKDRLRGATVDLRCGGEPVWSEVFLRDAASGAWHLVDDGDRLAFVIPAVGEAEAIVVPGDAGCARRVLHPGEQTVELPRPTTARVELRGLPAEVPANAIELVFYLLQRREPELDELGRDDAGHARQIIAWPRDAAELRRIADAIVVRDIAHDDGTVRSYPFVRRGAYLVLPRLARRATRQDLLDAAVPLEVAELGGTATVTIDFDTAKLLAAWRALDH